MDLRALTAKMNNRHIVRLLTLAEAEKLWKEDGTTICEMDKATVEVFYPTGDYSDIAYGMPPRQWPKDSLFATRELDHIDEKGASHYKMRTNRDGFNILKYLEAQ